MLSSFILTFTSPRGGIGVGFGSLRLVENNGGVVGIEPWDNNKRNMNAPFQ